MSAIGHAIPCPVARIENGEIERQSCRQHASSLVVRRVESVDEDLPSRRDQIKSLRHQQQRVLGRDGVEHRAEQDTVGTGREFAVQHVPLPEPGPAGQLGGQHVSRKVDHTRQVENRHFEVGVAGRQACGVGADSATAVEQMPYRGELVVVDQPVHGLQGEGRHRPMEDALQLRLVGQSLVER
jgi:hypothetical protein